MARLQPSTARPCPPTRRRWHRRRADGSGDESASSQACSSGRRPHQAVCWTNRRRIRRMDLNGGTGHFTPCSSPHCSRGSRDHPRPRGRTRLAGPPPDRANWHPSPPREEQGTTPTLNCSQFPTEDGNSFTVPAMTSLSGCARLLTSRPLWASRKQVEIGPLVEPRDGDNRGAKARVLLEVPGEGICVPHEQLGSIGHRPLSEPRPVVSMVRRPGCRV